jgi:succinate dehydrogenase/fumarate reductase-like Fe-S protein
VYESHTDTISLVTHDTITIQSHSVDTLHEYKVINTIDTIRDVQTKIITLRENGDTIREYINNNYYHYINQKDSSDRYQSKIDSMQKQITQLEKDKEKITNDKNKEVTKLKKNNFWKYVTCILCGVLIVGCLYIVWLKIKK